MKEDMQKEKSEYLLKWALEEQLKQDEEMNRYPSEDDIHEPHIFSAEHEERMKTVLKMAEKEENTPPEKTQKAADGSGNCSYALHQFSDSYAVRSISGSDDSLFFRSE